MLINKKWSFSKSFVYPRGVELRVIRRHLRNELEDMAQFIDLP